MQKIGKTVVFDKPPIIVGHAGVAGKKEGEGPLAKDFDMIFEDTTMGQQSYELAESAMLHDAIIRSLSNADVSPSAVDFCLAVICLTNVWVLPLHLKIWKLHQSAFSALAQLWHFHFLPGQCLLTAG